MTIFSHVVNKLRRQGNDDDDSATPLPMAALLVTVGVACGVLGLQAWDYKKPPSRMLSAQEDNHAASVGGDLLMIYDNEKQRPCRNVVNRWLVNSHYVMDGVPTPLWYPLDTGNAPPVAMGKQHYAVGIPVPQNVIPGHYDVVVTTDYYCGAASKLDPESRITQPATVDVTRASPDAQPQIVVSGPNGILLKPEAEAPK